MADGSKNNNYQNKIMGDYHLNIGNLDSTIYYYKRYSERDNTFHIGFFADDISELAIEKERYDIAVDIKIKALEKFGPRPNLFLQIGDIYNWYIEDYPKAFEYYTKGADMLEHMKSKGHVNLKTTNYEIYMGLGTLYNKKKQYDKSILYLEKVLTLKADAIDAAKLANEHYGVDNSPDLSKEVYFSSTYCYLANSYHAQGLLFLNDGKNDLAIQYCKKSLELENYQEKLLIEDKNDIYDCWHDFSFTYYLLGLAQYRIGDNSEAIQNLDRSILLDSKYYKPYEILGTIYYRQDDHLKTIQNLNKAIDLEPNCIDCYYYLGIEYIKKQNMPGAAENIEKAVDLGHNSLWAFKSLASHYYKYQDFEKSEKYYREAYKLEKDFESCYQLGVIYSKQNKNFDAIEFFEEANKLKPDNPKILSKLGKLHYKIAIAYHNNDDWPKALTFYRKAAKLDHKRTQEFLKKNGYDW